MEIICDKCGEVIPAPEWKTIRDGDIEHTYFTCSSCGALFPVCTTDGNLRRDIGKYKRMAAHIREGKYTESFHRHAQELKRQNITRSRELAQQYPLAPLLLQE